MGIGIPPSFDVDGVEFETEAKGAELDVAEADVD